MLTKDEWRAITTRAQATPILQKEMERVSAEHTMYGVKLLSSIGSTLMEIEDRFPKLPGIVAGSVLMDRFQDDCREPLLDFANVMSEMRALFKLKGLLDNPETPDKAIAQAFAQHGEDFGATEREKPGCTGDPSNCPACGGDSDEPRVTVTQIVDGQTRPSSITEFADFLKRVMAGETPDMPIKRTLN